MPYNLKVASVVLSDFKLMGEVLSKGVSGSVDLLSEIGTWCVALLEAKCEILYQEPIITNLQLP